MKLLKTIERIVEEAENNYYEASRKPISEKELIVLEKNLEESKKILHRFIQLSSK